MTNMAGVAPAKAWFTEGMFFFLFPEIELCEGPHQRSWALWESDVLTRFTVVRRWHVKAAPAGPSDLAD